MKSVISVELMRKSDAYTIKTKISSKELMYKAGKAIYDVSEIKGNTAIVCGSGNNAGDGYVIALEMAKDGKKTTLILLSDKFSDDGLYYFEKCKEAGVPYIYADENTGFEPYDEIIDCIFGTGFKGEPTGLTSVITDKINQSGKRVICVDINSGLNGDNGRFVKCVKSDLTVSVGYLKTGFFLGDAHKVIGKLINVDIGIILAEKGYILSEHEKLPSEYTLVDLPQNCQNPAEELISLAGGHFVRWQNIITDGKDTYILPGDTNYGN